VPRIDAAVVTVAPLNLGGVAADLVHAAGPDVIRHLRLPDDALAAPLLDAGGARASRPQPLRRELRDLAVVPADDQEACVVEGVAARAEELDGEDGAVLALGDLHRGDQLVGEAFAGEAAHGEVEVDHALRDAAEADAAEPPVLVAHGEELFVQRASLLVAEG